MRRVVVAVEKPDGFDVHRCVTDRGVEAIDTAALRRELPQTAVESERLETGCRATALTGLIDPVLDDVLIVCARNGSNQEFCVVTGVVDPTAVSFSAVGSDTPCDCGLLAEPDSIGVGTLRYRIQGARAALLGVAAATTQTVDLDTVFECVVTDWAVRTISFTAIDDETF